MLTRAELADELYRIAGPHKGQQVPRLMKLIDSYVVTMSHKLNPVLDWEPWGHLKPGDTDAEAGMRRCVECGHVKKLNHSFSRDNRCPYDRKLRCTSCRPPRRVGEQPGYICKACREEKPIEAFPPAKQANPHLTFHCLTCKPL